MQEDCDLLVKITGSAIRSLWNDYSSTISFFDRNDILTIEFNERFVSIYNENSIKSIDIKTIDVDSRQFQSYFKKGTLGLEFNPIYIFRKILSKIDMLELICIESLTLTIKYNQLYMSFIYNRKREDFLFNLDTETPEYLDYYRVIEYPIEDVRRNNNSYDSSENSSSDNEVEVRPVVEVKSPIKLPDIKNDNTIELSEDDLCRICMERKITTINLPCCHLFFCITCCHTYISNNNKNCPVCKTEIVEIKQFFK